MRRTWLCVSLAFVCLASAVAATLPRGCTAQEPTAAAEVDDEPVVLPQGLLAEYFVGDAAQPALTRIDALAAFRLEPQETLDPRLPPRGWRVEWTGQLEVLQPGQYQFAVESATACQLLLDGRPVPLATWAVQDQAASFELAFGLHELRIEVAAAADDSATQTFRLHWQSEKFPWEPLPPAALRHAPDVAPDDEFFHGRLAIEEQSCTACHLPREDDGFARGLLQRPGPHLTNAPARLNAAWVYHWLGNPHELRATAVMPRLFAADGSEDLQRYAVAAFLGGRDRPPGHVDAAQAAAGDALYKQIGCVVCHEPLGTLPPRADLRGLGLKTTPSSLAEFLLQPSAVDPAGRMPGFQLSAEQSLALAGYLIQRDAASAPRLELPPAPLPRAVREAYLGDDPPADAVVEFAALSQADQLAALALRVLREKRCGNCHELKQDERDLLAPVPAQRNWDAVCAQPQGGCLEASAAPARTPAPAFGASLDRPAATAFLQAAGELPAARSPRETARLTLARFHCLGCHTRDGQGGLSADLLARVLENQSPEAVESLTPPTLTGVSGKLQTAALEAVLLKHARVRPWMSIQMPRFLSAHVAPLPAALAALEGEPPHESGDDSPYDPDLAVAGRTLVGAQGFGCTKCHDMLGVATTGTRGPDLSLAAGRVTRAWFLRWMTDPQRLQPGTRMPTVFLNNQSPHTQILGGDPAQQRLALWQYLRGCESLPPPEGLQAPEAAELATADRPQLLRTFLPGVSARSLALRFPQGVHLAYDVQACRLAYAWSGDFLNLEPAWGGRGGNPAGLLGEQFWTSPAGFPWAMTSSAQPAPDFSQRGSDTRYGAPVPDDGQLHPRVVKFRGYRLHDGVPEFRYALRTDDGPPAEFTETVTPLASDSGRGVRRSVQVAAAAGSFAWLHVARSQEPPRWRTREASGQLDESGAAAPGTAAVRVVQDGQPLLLRLRGAGEAVQWVAAEQAGQWSLCVRLPLPDGTAAADLSLWRPADGAAEALWLELTQAE